MREFWKMGYSNDFPKGMYYSQTWELEYVLDKSKQENFFLTLEIIWVLQ